MKLATLAEDGWELDDGAAVHRRHPKTFYLPPVYQRWLLSRGEIVKLMFRIGLEDQSGERREEVERMWVIVQRRVGLKKIPRGAG